MIGKLRPRDCYSINYSIRRSREWTRQRVTTRPPQDLWTESPGCSLNHCDQWQPLNICTRNPSSKSSYYCWCYNVSVTCYWRELSHHTPPWLPLQQNNTYYRTTLNLILLSIWYLRLEHFLTSFSTFTQHGHIIFFY